MSTEVTSMVLVAVGLVIALYGVMFAGFAWFLHRMDERFEKLHRRFDKLEQRFEELDAKQRAV